LGWTWAATAPEAIALAVVAEVQAWVQGRLGAIAQADGGSLWPKQIAKGGASRYLQAQCALGAAK
jgi:hypothetical protein